MRLKSFASILFVFLALFALGQQLSKKINNQDVIDMVSLGLSDDVIIDKIHSAEATDFDTSVTALKTLKSAKVSDPIIRAMINPKPVLVPANASAAAAPASDDSGLPTEVGVYIMVKGKLTEIEPEVVGWQTGGLMKAMATGGLTKGHVNGKIVKAKSAIQVPNPIEVYIKTTEGTSVTEYQLLHLDQKGDRREFRAMTGGILHASGGSERNAVSVEPEKIGNRLWRIRRADLKKGEYGFLPPGISAQSISSSGKMYTFGVVE